MLELGLDLTLCDFQVILVEEEEVTLCFELVGEFLLSAGS